VTTKKKNYLISTRSRPGDSLGYWVFLIPSLIAVVGLIYVPLAMTTWESLQASGGGFAQQKQFVGLENYKKIISNGSLQFLLWNSFLWTVLVILGQNILGFSLAVLMNYKWRLSGALRSLFLIPWVLPGVVAAVLWRFMYDPQLGLVTSILSRIPGPYFEKSQFLAQPSSALYAVIVAAIWKGFAFSFIIYLAGLQTVDSNLLEAAEMDGAGFFRKIWNIVIPSMRTIISLNFLLTAIFTFNYFDLIWITTKGGPLNSSHIFPTYIFQVGFGEFNFNLAAAYGVVAFLVLLIILVPYLKQVRATQVEYHR
jgi:multiple sugar transport system permease protein